MRTSQLFLLTLKETPADAQVVSHQLMLRASMIRKLTSGIYTWLPLGLRVLSKVTQVIREEMNRTGAQELLMPAIQPAQLWQETERWEQFGSELLKITDRHNRAFCFGPTHEEVITDLVRGEVRSYKQLPVTLYQFQNKFRDEIRPRFGVMRAREFLMKDAYSFHTDHASLKETYEAMYQAYSRIFERLGLRFRAVLADNGAIGGSASHEFHVLADTGEDALAFSDKSEYAANLERAQSFVDLTEPPPPGEAMTVVDTGALAKPEDVAPHLGIPVTQIIKTLVIADASNNLTGLVVRADHDVNLVKATRLLGLVQLPRLATQDEIEGLGSYIGYIGPTGLDIPIIIDRDAAVLANFSCGANEQGKHYINANWERDIPRGQVADIRNVVEGDKSPDGKGHLYITRGIEVGHIFQLGDKYSKSMNATILNEQGKAVAMKMGCYGIGVSRVVAAAIEQSHDEKGIIWPEAMAPFDVVIIPLGLHKSYRVKEAAEHLYKQLTCAGFEVLFEDRNQRPGFLFSDHELIGIPHRLVISERNLDKNTLEYQSRKENSVQLLHPQDVAQFLERK